MYILGRDRKSDVNMQPAVLGCVSEMQPSPLESREMLSDLLDRGCSVREDSGHEFDRVSVPVLRHARLLEHDVWIPRWLRPGLFVQSLN